MTPPSLPVGAWWAIAAAAGVLYLVVMPSWMPTASTRYQVSLAPLVAAGMVYELHQGQHLPISQALAMGSGMLSGIPLATVWHRRELARRILDWEAGGSRRGELRAPIAMVNLFMVLVPGMTFLGWWLG